MKRKLNIFTLEERIVLDAAAAAVIADFAANSNIIYVDANNAGGTEDGSSWNTAYSDLQDALEAAEASAGADQIWIAEGRYTPSEIYSPDGVLGGNSGLNTSNLKTFNLPDQVALFGGFQSGMTSLAQRDSAAYETILDGDLLGNDINDKSDAGYAASKADNSWHVLIASNDVAGKGVEAIIDGLKVVNGYAAGPATPPLTNNEGLRSPHDYGGGMLINWNSEITVNDVTFEHNHANGDGGAMFYNNSDVLVANSTFLYNDAGLRGGAIEAFATEDINTQDHTMRITQSTFIGNSAFVFGGAVVAEGSEASDTTTMTIEKSYFKENHALEGGGVVVDSMNVDIKTSVFYRNTADVAGGAFATTNVVNQLVWGNDRFFTTRVSDSLFVENSARGDDASAAFLGSLFSDPGNLDIRFSQGGGAMVNYMRGILEVNRSTFINNSTEFGQGGAILSGDASAIAGGSAVIGASAETSVKRSLFINNSALEGGAIAATSVIGFVPESDVDRNTLDVRKSTFISNDAENTGGSIYLDSVVADIKRNLFSSSNDADAGADQVYASDSEVNGHDSSENKAKKRLIMQNRFFMLRPDDLELV